ncbi:hypothetical protein RRG08_048798 [Elysia crispata]|uniref:Uncharacterized protein n=1 Tax=Elysia crispata TaxID=231223 RepID=A0AAE1AMU4_9GAST|nr:hypothetical protein RRG08_048798 [Elysia crispata]
MPENVSSLKKKIPLLPPPIDRTETPLVKGKWDSQIVRYLRRLFDSQTPGDNADRTAWSSTSLIVCYHCAMQSRGAWH